MKILFIDGTEILTYAVHFFPDGIRWSIPLLSQQKNEAKYSEIQAIVTLH